MGHKYATANDIRLNYWSNDDLRVKLANNCLKARVAHTHIHRYNYMHKNLQYSLGGEVLNIDDKDFIDIDSVDIDINTSW